MSYIEFFNGVNTLGKNGRCAMYSESIGSYICLTGIDYCGNGSIDDYALFYRIDGDEWGKNTRSKIQYTKKDNRAFFISRGKRIFLDNFIKTY